MRRPHAAPTVPAIELDADLPKAFQSEGDMNEEISNAVVGALAGVLGLLGLFLIARAHDSEMSVFGYGLAAFGVLFVFGRISDHYNQKEARAAAARKGVGHD